MRHASCISPLAACQRANHGGNRDAPQFNTPAARDLNEVPSEVWVLTSSAGAQTSCKDERLAHGLFSYYVAKGLTEAALKRGDGILTASDQFEYVAFNVPRHVESNYPDSGKSAETPQLRAAVTRPLIRGTVAPRR